MSAKKVRLSAMIAFGVRAGAALVHELSTVELEQLADDEEASTFLAEYVVTRAFDGGEGDPEKYAAMISALRAKLHDVEEKHTWDARRSIGELRIGETQSCVCGLARQWSATGWLYAELASASRTHDFGAAEPRACTGQARLPE